MAQKRLFTQSASLSPQPFLSQFLTRWLLSLTLLLFLFFPGRAFCAGADATTLLGVKGFRIEIGRVSRTARSLGVENGRLRAIAQRRLRRASVPIGDFPTVLVLSLHTVEQPTSVLAYCLDVEVRQRVHLTRTEQLTLLAPTWAEGKLTMTLRTSFVHSVEDALAVLLDDLARDYQLVNTDVFPEFPERP